MKQEIFIQTLRLIVADNYEEMSQVSADLIYDEINKKRNLFICAAAGSTPTRTYELLVTKYHKKRQTFEQLRIIKLDEWVGLPMNDPATCEVYLQNHLVQPLNIDPSRYIAFNSSPDNPREEIQTIAKRLNQEGRIDLCILGIGINGHLGLNEPSSFLYPDTNLSELSTTTKKHPMLQKTGHSVQYGLSLGINDIMRSKSILLLVNGAHKEEAFKKFLSRKITTQFPVSMLWLHSNVTVVCDKETVPEIDKI